MRMSSSMWIWIRRRPSGICQSLFVPSTLMLGGVLLTLPWQRRT
ncbi:HLA class II histocompatibility antigen [Prionailurus iriomotensis]